MSLIILEGLDRTGKSTLAKHFESEGYQIIHMSAPDKKYYEAGYVGPSYLDEMIELIHSATYSNIVLDRSHYGEIIWSQVYGRKSLLSDEDIEILRELEEAAGVRRILMHDPDSEAHWQRCVDNKEPLTRPQFLRARNLYDRLATKYKFERMTYEDIPGNGKTKSEALKAQSFNQLERPDVESNEASVHQRARDKSLSMENFDNKIKSEQQIKLEKANAINDILSKKILKSKSPVYDEIEDELRSFLNKKLGTILGSNSPSEFSEEEIIILRALANKVKNKAGE